MLYSTTDLTPYEEGYKSTLFTGECKYCVGKPLANLTKCIEFGRGQHDANDDKRNNRYKLWLIS